MAPPSLKTARSQSPLPPERVAVEVPEGGGGDLAGEDAGAVERPVGAAAGDRAGGVSGLGEQGLLGARNRRQNRHRSAAFPAFPRSACARESPFPFPFLLPSMPQSRLGVPAPTPAASVNNPAVEGAGRLGPSTLLTRNRAIGAGRCVHRYRWSRERGALLRFSILAMRSPGYTNASQRALDSESCSDSAGVSKHSELNPFELLGTLFQPLSRLRSSPGSRSRDSCTGRIRIKHDGLP